jgi:hypothetical protein
MNDQTHLYRQRKIHVVLENMLSILDYVLGNRQIAIGNKKDKNLNIFTGIISHVFHPSIWKTEVGTS